MQKENMFLFSFQSGNCLFKVTDYCVQNDSVSACLSEKALINFSPV